MNCLSIKQLSSLGKIFVLIIQFLFVCFGNSVSAMEKKVILYYEIPVRDYLDITSKNYFNFNPVNSNDLFVVKDKLFALASRGINGKETPIGYDYETILFSHKLDENEWTKSPIPGKAYYLGDIFNNEICSIKQNKEEIKWFINFYDVNGNKLRELEHKYRKFRKEYYHYVPFPVTYSDGSIIFFSQYEYETRNYVLGILLGLISGGHGWKPANKDYIELIPDLIKKDSKRTSFAYANILDRSKNRIVFGIEDDVKFNFDGFSKKVSQISGYEIKEYKLIDDKNFYFYKDGKLVKISDKVEVYDINKNQKESFPLPPFTEELYYKGQFKLSGVDVQIDFKDHFIFSIKPDDDSLIYLYFYNKNEQKWTRKLVPNIEDRGDLELFLWSNYLYIGVWNAPHKFRVIRCKISDLESSSVLP